MDLRDAARAADTRLNDLQADIEAGSRQLERIGETGATLHQSLTKSDSRHARLLASLMKAIRQLKSCLMQQRDTLRELRHDIRRIRGMSERNRTHDST